MQLPNVTSSASDTIAPPCHGGGAFNLVFIMKILAYLVFGLDNALYKAFGIVSPIRRAYWRRRAKELQNALDYQHNKVAKYNSYATTKMTGKYYVEKYGMIDSIYELNHLGEI